MITARTLLLLALLFAATVDAGENWPQFRGPTQDGHSDSKALPVEWSEGSKNIKWKTAIPGQGWSSPVIWGDQVWMTTATEGGKSMRAVCVDRNSGKIVHDVEVFRHEQVLPKNDFNSYASPTPVVEEGRVYVSFGTYGNACLDTKTAKVVWKNQELKLDHKEGPGSSPTLHGGRFILHCDGMDVQYLVALDKDTGRIAWKTARSTDFGGKPPDLKKAYSIPTVVPTDGGDQLISVAASSAFSYDAKTGKELWRCAIPGFSNVPRPVVGHGLAYVCTGYMQPELWAIKLGGMGDVSDSHVAWKFTQGVPAKPSILLFGERIFVVSDTGIARCLNALTGDQIWQQRLADNYSASPLYAGGRIYFFSEQGTTTVIEPADEFKQVAENELEGRFMASPAVSGNALFLRTDTHLYRIED